jgi:hypothetical protein
MAKKFGYRSLRWIKQDWRFIKYTGRDGNLKATFKYPSKCGRKGGVLPDGRVRLCLPKAVIDELKRTKAGAEALRQQVADKLQRKPGERTQYNETVLKVFQDFQKKDSFKDIPKLDKRAKRDRAVRSKAKKEKVQIPLFDEKTLTARDINSLDAFDKMELMKKLDKKTPITITKYFQIIKKVFPNVSATDLVTFYIDNPVTLNVKEIGQEAGDNFGNPIKGRSILYVKGAYLLVKTNYGKARYKIGNSKRLKDAQQKKVTYSFHGMVTANWYTEVFEYLVDGFKIKKGKTEFTPPNTLFSFIGEQKQADMLKVFVKFPQPKRKNLPFPKMYEFQWIDKKHYKELAQVIKPLYTIREKIYIRFQEFLK